MRKSVAAFGCSVVMLLAGCGSDSSGDGTDATTPATATTSTAAPNATSSSAAGATPTTAMTTTSPTLAPSTIAPSTIDMTTRPTVPGTDSGNTGDTGSAGTAASGTAASGTAASGTAASGTAASGTTAAGATGGSSIGMGEFRSVAPPDVPQVTRVVTADDSHPDGVYFASVSEGGDPPPAEGSVVFEIVQLFRGPACADHFGADDEDACVNDYGLETEPTSFVEVALGDQFISVVDAATQQSYQVSGEQLDELLLGELPPEGAPVDYMYSAFGYLVTYAGGEITRLEQWWTP